jgi:Protein of unknown function with PCYCGC motif
MRKRIAITVILFLACSLLEAALIAQQMPAVSPDAYHHSPPTEPLPPTLDYTAFHANRSAFVAYALAARIEPTLYQVPCYCPCRREKGHRSLLECFTSTHGVTCRMCQKEVLFCYLQKQKGNTPTRIREAMAAGRLSKLDFDKAVDRFFKTIEK